MQHIFSVDVEDWFHGFPPGYLDGSRTSSRLEIGMNFLLDSLDEAGAKATFFWIGREAEKHPALLRETADRGHEIGCHSYDHTPIYQMEPSEFEGDTGRAIEVISDITGRSIRSYRAPYFSVRHDTLWALEILASVGITHDSSILPMRHWRTGMPESGDSIRQIKTPSGTIVEVPVTIRKLFGVRIPTAGGGYFRVYPYELTLSNFADVEARKMPAVFYIHPWEFDPAQPRLQGNGIRERMHYAGLKTSRANLIRLLRDHSFGPMIERANEFLNTPESKAELAHTLK